jgi:hypothetical protein
MRTVTTVTNVYTIEELGCANRTTALEAVARMREEDFNEFHSYDLINSMKEAAWYFHMKVTDYSVGLLKESYVSIDIGRYAVLGNEDKNEGVRWINENIEEGVKGGHPLTGTHYDCYFFDYFKEKGPTSHNTLHKDVPKAIVYMLEKAVEGEETLILSDEDNEQYAKENELEFRSDGTYYGQYI